MRNNISRKEFIKFTSFSLFGMWLPTSNKQFRSLINQQGRVIPEQISVYDQPTFSSSVIQQYWHDTVLDIEHVTIGDNEPEYNRIWYKIAPQGYVHSGIIQPVETQVNPAVSDLPSNGALAEVTVPYTDAHLSPGKEYAVAYRYYYETTHWVDRLFHDKEGNPWYRIREDKWEQVYYAPAQHLRIVPANELSTMSPQVPPQAKRIEVRLNEQVVVAYEWERPVFMTKAATGAKFSNGRFSTPIGRHYTFHKRPSRHMAAGNLAANGYDLPGVPWVSYITESGVAFHGTYWHNDFGHPRSHGCINLSSKASKWLYRWTLPLVPKDEQKVYKDSGTPVDVI